MSIEVRNFKPEDSATNVSIYRNIEFDLVALDGYTIDISTLKVTIQMNSNIDDDTHSVEYVTTDDAISYSGTSTYYRVLVNADIPFDEGLDITVLVDIDGTDELSAPISMEQYESTFSTYYSGIISDFRYAFIHEAQRIPVYQEQLRKNSSTAPKIFDSAFDDWNKNPVPKIFVNQVQYESDDATYGYTIDYEGGKIIFNSPLSYNDMVEASYRFAFFKDEHIDSFFKQANAYWNMHPPMGGPRSIYNASSSLQGALMVGAATFAFRDLIMSLSMQEIRIIFDNSSDGQGWTQVQGLFRDLLNSLDDMWKSLLESKKAALPNIVSVITPQYTMPGGRSRMFRYLYKSDV